MMTASTHDKMLNPLAINVEVAERLIQQSDDGELKDMAQVILVNSKIVMFHANDVLDHKMIQNGNFVPSKSYQFVSQTVLEIVQMMGWTLK